MTRSARGKHAIIDVYGAGKGEELTAPKEPEDRPVVVLPYLGPRSPEEWDAAVREMYDNDPEFREWQDAERRAEWAVLPR